MNETDSQAIMKKTIRIEGMHCAGCTNAVQRAIERVDGVKSANVQLTTEQAVVESDGDQFPLNSVKEAIENAGYSVVQESNESELVLGIEGMHCTGCSSAVEKALMRKEGVLTATVNLAAENAYVTFDPELTNENKLAEAVREAGYKVTGQKKKDLTG
jgi:P-type Cu+ transporter